MSPTLRKLTRYAMVAVLSAVQVAPAFAQQTYYRYVISDTFLPQPGQDDGGWTPPPGGGNSENEPHGEILVDIPPSVRARLGVPMNLRLEAQGAEGAVEWSIGGNTLPAGLSFSRENGTVTGTPSAVGQTPDLAVRAVDAAGREGYSRRFTLDVQPPPSITFPSSLTASDAEDFSATPQATHVFGSQTWSVEGILPYGISVDPLTGTLSGRPQQSGSFDGLRLRLTDGDGASASVPFSIETTTSLGVSGLSKTYRIRAGKPFSSTQPQTTGATSTTTWSAAGNPLPSGLTVDPRTGIVSGVPTETGKTEGVYVRVTQDDGKAAVFGPVTFDVVGDLTATAEDIYVRLGNNVDARPVAENVIGPLQWSLAGAPLPSGLEQAASGRIVGSPDVTGTTEGVVLGLVDTADGGQGTSNPFDIHVWSPLRALPPGMPRAVEGTPVAIGAPSATGLRGEPSWSVNGLPPGLAFDPDTLEVAGTPTQSGTFVLAYTVRDSSDNATATTGGVKLRVDPVPVPGALAFVDFPETFRVRGGGTLTTVAPTLRNATGAATYTLEGAKPGWLQVNAATGQLYGVAPSVTENTETPALRLAATDSQGRTATSPEFTVTVRAPGPLDLGIVGPTFRAVEGVPFSSGLPPVSGGSGAFDFSLSAALPAWLSFDPATGMFVGTPAPGAAGAAGLTLSVRDAVSGETLVSNAFDVAVLPPGASFPSISGIAPAYATKSGKAFSTGVPVLSGIGSPHSFSLVGDLPDWADLDEATGAVSGVAGPTGLYGPFSVRARDASGASVLSIPFTVSVTAADPISASAQSTYAATEGTPFSMRPSVSNAQGAVTWAMASDFPEWVVVDRTTGTVSGIPDTVGPSAGLVLRATDATGASAVTRAFTIDVAPQPPMTVAAMAASYVGQSGAPLVIDPPSVSRAVGTVSWSLASGTLPGWASLSASTGRITGTPNSLARTEGLSLRATDSTGNSAVGGIFSIEVQPAALRVSASPQSVSVRSGASVTTSAPSVSGAEKPVNWSVASGTLPPWAVLDAETGRVSGVSVGAGSWPGIVLRATEETTGRSALSSPFAVTVTDPNPAAAVTAHVEARTYNEVSVRPSATGIIGTPTWRLSSGTKPAWLTLDPATGRLHGTPTEVGTVTGLVLTVRDSHDNREGSTGALTINVEDGTPVVEVPEDNVFRVGKAFALSPSTSDTVGATTYELTGGSLPEWATLNRSTGRISGTPTTATTAPGLRLKVTDQRGISGHSSDFAVAARPALTASLDQPDIDIRPGTAVLTATPSLSGAGGEATWSVAGTLPSGVSLDPASGVISGVARSTGTYQVALRVTDPSDNTVVTAGSFVIRVVGEPKASITPDIPARVGMPVSVRASSTDTIGAVTWRVAAGTLPSWAELDAETGTVSGVPDATGTSTSATLEVRDAQGLTARTGSFRFSVTPRIRIDLPSSTTAARVGRGYAFQPLRADGADGSVTWELTTPMPEWASFDPATGRVSGVPSETGAFSIAYRATDAAGNTATSAVVDGAVTTNPVVTVSNRTTRVNADFSFQPGISGTVGGFTTRSVGNPMPHWAIIGSNTGRVRGEPTETGTYTGLRLRVTDSEGISGVSEPFSITVTDGIAVTSPARSTEVRIGSNVTVPPATVSGAVGAVTWSLASGVLPRGVSVDPATGALTGQASTSGTHTYRLRARDGHDGAYAYGPQSSITVVNSVRVSNVPFEYVGHVNAPFSMSPAPSPVNTRGTRTWSVTGTLPGWASLDPATGRITGTPDETGTASGLRLRLHDSFDNQTGTSSSFAVRIVPELLVTNMATSYSARYGFPFVQATPVARDAVGSVSWQVVTGTLPGWASFDPATGRISGTPDEVGRWEGIAVEATDSTGAKARSALFDIDAYSEPTVSMPTGQQKLRVGTAAVISPTGRGAVGTRIWAVAEGALPPGLQLSGTTGRISGTPTEPGNYTATIRMTDSYDGQFAEAALSVGVSETLSLEGIEDEYRVRVGQFLTTGQAALVGARASISFSHSGTLPAGVTFSGGRYSGMVSTGQSPRSYQVTVTGRDSHDQATASRTFSITTLGTLSAGASSLNVRSGQELPGRAAIVSNAVGRITWSLAAGTLPPGTALDEDTGAITGAVTVAERTTWSGIRLRATDEDGATALTAAISVTVDNDLAMTGPSNGSGVKNTPFSMPAFTASGSLGTVAWSANGLPSGLRITGTGERLMTASITGTPNVSGTFPVTVTARDPIDNSSVTVETSIFLDTVPVISMGNVIAFVGKAVSQQPSIADKGNGTVTWRLTLPDGSNGVSSLPSGLSFSTQTGRISGTASGTTPTSGVSLRLQAIEARTVDGSTVQVPSNTVSFTVRSSLPPLSVAMADVSGTRSVAVAATTPVLTNAIGSTRTYRLYVYSGTNRVIALSDVTVAGDSTSTTYFPRGLTFSTSTGRIAGTPTVAWNRSYTYRIWVQETRSVNGSTVYDTVESDVFTIKVADWADPVVTMGNIVGDRSVAIPTTTPSTVTHPTKVSGTYRLYVYSGTNHAATLSDVTAAGDSTSTAYFPRGLTFSTSTGRIAGTPTVAWNRSYTYRIWYQEGRQVNNVMDYPTTESNPFTIKVADWADPVVTMDNIDGDRSVAIPTTTPSTVTHPTKVSGTYRLYVYSGTNRVIALSDVSAAGDSTSTTYFPRGLTFSTSTGRIAGTPTVAWNRSYTYRIWYQEGRQVNGVTDYPTTESNAFTIKVADWADPVVTMGNIVGDRSVAIQSVTPSTVTHPTKVSGTYRLYVYSGTSRVAVLSDVTVAGDSTSTTYFPRGLTFSTSTGRIAGTPTVAWNRSYTYRIWYQEGRQVNNVMDYPTTESNAFTIKVEDWAYPVVAMGDITGIRGTVIPTTTPSTTTHPTKVSGTYRLYVYSGTNRVIALSDVSAAGDSTSTTYFPRGLTFSTSTGRIAGTPTVAWNRSYTYRIWYQEGRMVNNVMDYPTAESNPFTIKIGE